MSTDVTEEDKAFDRRAKAWELRFKFMATIGGLLAILVPVLTSIITSAQSQRMQIAQAAETQRSQARQAAKEFDKAQDDSAVALFTKATSAAAQIVSEPKFKETLDSRRTFHQLYYGEMVLYETKSIEKAMVGFETILRGIANQSVEDPSGTKPSQGVARDVKRLLRVPLSGAASTDQQRNDEAELQKEFDRVRPDLSDAALEIARVCRVELGNRRDAFRKKYLGDTP